MRLFLIIISFLGQSVAMATSPEYKEFKALFESAKSPLTIEEVPNAAVMHAENADIRFPNVLKTRLAFRKVLIGGKVLLYISEVGDEKMSDGEAVRHLEGCGKMFPAAEENKIFNALVHWHAFTNTREFFKENPESPFPLSYSLFRTVPQLDQTSPWIVVRSDSKDPGHKHAELIYPRLETSNGNFFLAKKGLEAVEPNIDIEPDCQKLSPEMVWQKVELLK